MKIYLFTITFFCLQPVYAQMVVPQQVRAANNLDRIDSRGISTGDFMLGIPPEAGKTIGAAYLDEQWHMASLNLYEGDKVLNGYPIRYNLRDQVLEVNTQLGIRTASIQKIKSFRWLDSTSQISRVFINAKDYRTADAPLNGFLELLVKGRLSLFKRTSVTIKEPNYVPALAMGSMDEKLTRQTTYYYSADSMLIKVKNQKTLLNAFADRRESMNAFIKSKSLDIKKEDDLIKVINEYNDMANNPVK